MSAEHTAIAIVDYGLGNLYSVKQACRAVDLDAAITSDRAEILAADALILPGVGAFGDAMNTLHRLDLVSVIHDFVATGKPLLGVCLGLQLLMTESEEFGAHKGLDIINGRVVKIVTPPDAERPMKVPQIGWSGVMRYDDAAGDPWAGTLFDGMANGEPMYFVHSFVVEPADAAARLARSAYGRFEFCSAVAHGNVTACQFHPERSGPQGLAIYRRLGDRARAHASARALAAQQ